MKKGIHPDYYDCTVTCSCGNSFKTKSTKKELKVEICSNCHPFYTGKQKLIDSGGRVDRFQKRLSKKKKQQRESVMKIKYDNTPKASGFNA